jgi:phosphoribosyl 1,2-cyclic phosphodiesterase
VQVTFWGTRGSIAKAGPTTVRYGGNTSCVSVRTDAGTLVVLDCGTGIHELGQVLTADGGRVDGHLLIGHTHWDHIQGLPFFLPLAAGGGTVDVYGPRQAEGSLDEVFTGVMRPPYFPIRPDQLAGLVRFHDAGTDDFAVNGAKVRSRWVRHTGPTLGFRVEVEGVSVAYISDHGPGCYPEDADDYVPPDVLEVCDGVDLLIHDAQHTSPEYEKKRTWGHCTIEYAIHVAREAGAGRLALFHHCPTHGDDDLDTILRDAQDLVARRGGPEILAARDGMQVELGGPRAGS